MCEIVFDIESDGFLDVVTKVHCLSWNLDGKPQDTIASYQDIRTFFDIYDHAKFIGHNIICYDLVVLKRLLKIRQPTNLVDTLALSWYLQPERPEHGLESYGEDFGIPKPKVNDWSEQPMEVYIERCQEDVKINQALWNWQKRKLAELYN